jgi:hypothetical protein
VRTDELIIQLARAAGPVSPLPRPSVRLARWTALALPATALGILAIGPRAGLWTAIHQPAFAGLAVATLATALLSAAVAFVLSVPGVERSPVQRLAPLAAGGVWAFLLGVLLTTGGDAVGRVLALPFHAACVIEIAGLGIVPGWALFGMLRLAAPLRRCWSAALATLAAVALGALATQFICPIDDPAHQLVGHLLPVALFSIWGAVAGRGWLDWLNTPQRTSGR